jgi:hypothetical protein
MCYSFNNFFFTNTDSFAEKRDYGKGGRATGQQHLLFPGYNSAFFAAKPQKPGFSLQFLGLASQVLQDFLCNPLRPTGFLHFMQLIFLEWR